jgi:ribonucleotide monophosphatase NagD (HAD superfamily)
VNVDRTYVGADGGLVPGCGVMVAALERAVGRGPDVIVGKPSVTLLLEAAASLGQPASACLYVGDNPEADVAGAHAAGMDAMLVLTGVASQAEAAGEQPEHVLASVADLTSFFEPTGESHADVTLRQT